MTSAGVMQPERATVCTVVAARAAGAEAVEMLAESERLRARAVAALIDFDVLDAHAAEGYATPQRHLIHRGNIVRREADRLHRIIRFAAQHTLVADALDAGDITVDHADALRTAAHAVGAERFDDAALDLLAAAEGVDFAVFADRIEVWTWRTRPEQTANEVEDRFEQRYLSIQGDVFGGCKGHFSLDAASAVLVTKALATKPDPVDAVAPQRTLGQRRADRLVELADLALNGTPLNRTTLTNTNDDELEVDVSGGRQTGGRSIDVVIDLPTLMGVPFDLVHHRTPDGQVDWSSIQQSFTATGSAPRPVLQQFFCDASYRQLITSGPRVVLDYNKATPGISPALRRAIQRRDHHCQFEGCDRAVRFAHYWSCSLGLTTSPATQPRPAGQRMSRTWRWCAGSITHSSIKPAGNSPANPTADYSPPVPEHRALVTRTPTKQRLPGSNHTVRAPPAPTRTKRRVHVANDSDFLHAMSARSRFPT